jgi:hypothetical protein
LARSFLDPALPKGDRKKKIEGYGEPALGALLGLEDPVNHSDWRLKKKRERVPLVAG